ncbi:MAG: hypothetical protein MJ078_01560, partial [Clostridia bacterium]|nr:hypothetical protein [Clostridia bacterium]
GQLRHFGKTLMSEKTERVCGNLRWLAERRRNTGKLIDVSLRNLADAMGELFSPDCFFPEEEVAAVQRTLQCESPRSRLVFASLLSDAVRRKAPGFSPWESGTTGEKTGRTIRVAYVPSEKTERVIRKLTPRLGEVTVFYTERMTEAAEAAASGEAESALLAFEGAGGEAVSVVFRSARENDVRPLCLFSPGDENDLSSFALWGTKSVLKDASPETLLFLRLFGEMPSLEEAAEEYGFAVSRLSLKRDGYFRPLTEVVLTGKGDDAALFLYLRFFFSGTVTGGKVYRFYE